MRRPSIVACCVKQQDPVKTHMNTKDKCTIAWTRTMCSEDSYILTVDIRMVFNAQLSNLQGIPNGTIRSGHKFLVENNLICHSNGGPGLSFSDDQVLVFLCPDWSQHRRLGTENAKLNKLSDEKRVLALQQRFEIRVIKDWDHIKNGYTGGQQLKNRHNSAITKDFSNGLQQNKLWMIDHLHNYCLG